LLDELIAQELPGLAEDVRGLSERVSAALTPHGRPVARHRH
jgi:hypothetical protein